MGCRLTNSLPNTDYDDKCRSANAVMRRAIFFPRT
jgi:hypothetical protein